MLGVYIFVQGLCSTDPSQETCRRSCRLYGYPSGNMNYHTAHRTDQGSINFAWQISVGMGDLFPLLC